MSREIPIKQLDEDLRAFYLSKEYDEALFEVWERGEARGDSTTPSVCSPAYRTWMLDQLRTALAKADGGSLLSLGAGNAFIERILVDEGYDVLAVDFLQSAVDVALRATVPAIREDIRTWDPGSRWDVVYADGLLGHLYGGEGGCTEVLARMRSWLTSPGALIVSNDAPPSPTARRRPGRQRLQLALDPTARERDERRRLRPRRGGGLLVRATDLRPPPARDRHGPR